METRVLNFIQAARKLGIPMKQKDKRKEIFYDILDATTSLSEASRKFYYEKDTPEALKLISLVKEYLSKLEHDLKQMNLKELNNG